MTLNVHYLNAVAAVEDAAGSDNAVSRSRVERFLKTATCSVCHGTRLRPEALRSTLDGRNLAEISALTLDELRGFVERVPGLTPKDLARVAERPGEGVPAGARPAAPAGPRLPAARPGRQHAVNRRAAAPRADVDRPRQHHRHALRARRALRRPAPEQHRGAALDHRDARRQRQFGGDGRARDRHHQRRRLGDRARPRGRRRTADSSSRRARRPMSAQPELGHRPVPGRPAGRPPRTRRPGDGEAVIVEVADLYNLHDVRASFPERRDDRGGRAVRRGQDRPGP